MTLRTRRPGVTLSVLVLCGILGLAGAAHAALGVGPHSAGDIARKNTGNPRVVPPQASAYGRTYGEWGAEWWKWAVSFPFTSNPVFDPTGAFNEQGQTQIPWFLAGSAGGVGERSVTIPGGRPVFLPLLCIGNDYPCPDPTFQPAPGQSLEDFLAEGAKALADMTDVLSAEVDGVALKNLARYRGASKLEYWTEDPSLTANWDPCGTGSPQPFVSDGYWLMLPPFTPGEHTIHFMGGISQWFVVDMTYHVTVPGDGGVTQALPGAARPAGAVAPVSRSWGQLKVRYR